MQINEPNGSLYCNILCNNQAVLCIILLWETFIVSAQLLDQRLCCFISNNLNTNLWMLNLQQEANDLPSLKVVTNAGLCTARLARGNGLLEQTNYFELPC